MSNSLTINLDPQSPNLLRPNHPAILSLYATKTALNQTPLPIFLVRIILELPFPKPSNLHILFRGDKSLHSLPKKQLIKPLRTVPFVPVKYFSSSKLTHFHKKEGFDVVLKFEFLRSKTMQIFRETNSDE